MLAARQLRGRTTLADIGFPVLLLHAGHTENILMGYQIAFTFTVCFLGVFALLAARSGEMRPDRAAWRGALLLLPIAMGGWLGLVFVPPLALWVAWQWWRSWRASTGGRVGRVATAAVLVAVVGYLSWSLVIMLGAKMGSDSALPFGVRIRGLLEVLGIGIGPGKLEREGLLPAGCVLLAVQALTAWGWRSWASAARSGRWPGGCSRSCWVCGPSRSASAIRAARGGRPATPRSPRSASRCHSWRRATPAQTKITALVVLAVVVGTALQLPKNYKHAKTQAHLQRAVYASVESTRPRRCRSTSSRSATSTSGSVALRAGKSSGNSSSRSSATFPDPSRAGRSRDIRARRPEQRPVPGLHHAGRVRRRKDVLAIRVKFRPGAQTAWEDLHFVWTDPITGTQRRSSVRPWVRPPNRRGDVVLDRRPDRGGDLWAGRDGCRIDIISVGYLPGRSRGGPPLTPRPAPRHATPGCA